jgi:ElaB protein
MLTSPNGTDAKRDLHVGGVGSDASAALASVIDPLLDASENWVHKARNLAAGADDYVRDNPWQALGVVALLGVTLGYLLSRRF